MIASDNNKLHQPLALIILASFFFGAYALENLGIKYVSEGGSIFFKIHIFSYVGVFISIQYFISSKRRDLSSLLGDLYWPWICLIGSIFWLIGYGLVIFGFSGMAYIVDTLLVPTLLFPIVLSISSAKKNKILILMIVLMVFNGATALLEFIFSARLWSSENEWVSYFRSHAWLAHPLNNSLIMASLMPILIFHRFINPVILFGLTLVALLSFGARTATGIYLILSGAALLLTLRATYFEKRGLSFFEFIGYFVFLLVFPLGLYFLMDNFNIGARIFENMIIDASGQARLDVFYVFKYLSSSELFYGAHVNLIDNISYFINNTVIENYMVGWLLLYGAIGAAPLIFSMLYFFYCLIVRCHYIVALSIISFLLISISNNALMSKTPALLFIFFAIACVSPVGFRRASSDSLLVN